MTTTEYETHALLAPPGVAAVHSRPEVRGKFLFAGQEKLYIRGTTYGTFECDGAGRELYDLALVERDFACMAANGFNAVRTYTVPPVTVLDLALHFGLRIMVGLPWEQHVAFLDDAALAERIEARMREDVRSCGAHPAILCYSVGNEIPAPIIRWHGRRRVERFIERLYHAIKAEDPGALVTYVNYPTSEYLQLGFLDFASFNVYLEAQQPYEAYLSRLQNLAGDRPLVMAEVGLDSRSHGEMPQAHTLEWQLLTIFESGCAGAFVFAWTDEWHRGGHAIDDWDFGLTRRDRSPKPALATVRDAFEHVPFRSDIRWPRISVIVCAFNAQATLRECLEALQRVDYPNVDVIVVNDGSTDDTGAIAAQYPVQLISTENRGLSAARNTGLQAARGELVAYLDSDAFPDEHWLKYIAAAFIASPYVGIGGPNLAPPGLGRLAKCFDNAPGGPVHVLLSDREAEHIPGCNMAFRRTSLEAIGGFDPKLRIAGDDVDICWRLQARGWSLGFSPGAVVWHHRRTTLRSYWKQQRGYGRAEALLEKKWPEKYNVYGHPTWGGRIYVNTAAALGLRRSRVYQGSWGNAPYQPLETAAPGPLSSLTLMPEWYLVIAALAVLAGLGAVWTPLLGALPILGLAIGIPLARAAEFAKHARLEPEPASRLRALAERCFIAFLHVVHPLARLQGRLENGLTAWRVPVAFIPLMIVPRTYRLWSERWRSQASWLQDLEEGSHRNGVPLRRGGDYDCWDLEARSGALGFARLLMAVEEHGAGKQLVRVRTWPGYTLAAVSLSAVFGALSFASGIAGAWAACAILGALGVGVALRATQECASAMTRFERVLKWLELASPRPS